MLLQLVELDNIMTEGAGQSGQLQLLIHVSRKESARFV
jgi:hypothetical protein